MTSQSPQQPLVVHGTWSALRRHVLPLLLRQRWLLLAGLATLILVDWAQLWAPRLSGQAINALQEGASLAGPVWSLVAVGVAVAALRWLWRVCFVGASRRVRRDLRARLYDRVLGLDGLARSRYSSGDLITRATTDVEAVGMACGFGILAAADALVMILLVAHRVPAVGGLQAAWALIPLPFMALWVLWAGRQVHHRFQAVQEGNSALSEEARELLAASRYVKGSGRAAELCQGFVQANAAQRAAALDLARINSWFDPVIMSLAAIAQAILLLAVGARVIAGELAVGAVVELAGYVALLTWPAMAIGWSVNLLQRGAVAGGRIGAVIDEPTTMPCPAQPLSLATANSLRVVDLDLQLGTEQVLSSIDLELQVGEVVGLVGPSGAGKTTLLRCLARLQAVPSSSLFYGSVAAEDADPAAARGLVAFAAQEPVLFAGTVRENICLADADCPQQRVEAAARAAGIHDEILSLPSGYEAPLGERGLTLSGGQRARIGLARALVCEVPFLLLDDCLAAVDGDRAAQVVAGLRAAVGSRGALVVAHRLATVAACDRILVLEGGRISEQGTHHQLLQAGGHYAQIWALQHGATSDGRTADDGGGHDG